MESNAALSARPACPPPESSAGLSANASLLGVPRVPRTPAHGGHVVRKPGARVVASPPDDPEFQHLLVAAEYNLDNGAQLRRLAYDISEGTYDPSPAQILHVFRVCLKRGAFEHASAFLEIPRCAEALGREKPRVAAAIANRTPSLG